MKKMTRMEQIDSNGGRRLVKLSRCDCNQNCWSDSDYVHALFSVRHTMSGHSVTYDSYYIY